MTKKPHSPLRKWLLDATAKVVASVIAAALIGVGVMLFDVSASVRTLVTKLDEVISPVVKDHEARIRELERWKGGERR